MGRIGFRKCSEMKSRVLEFGREAVDSHLGTDFGRLRAGSQVQSTDIG